MLLLLQTWRVIAAESSSRDWREEAGLHNMIMMEWGDMTSQSPRIRCVDKYVVLDILCLVSTNHAGNANPSVWVCLVKRSLQVSEIQPLLLLWPLLSPQFIITPPEAEIRCLLKEWYPLCEKCVQYMIHIKHVMFSTDFLNRFCQNLFINCF